jgi:hypothetical protein
MLIIASSRGPAVKQLGSFQQVGFEHAQVVSTADAVHLDKSVVLSLAQDIQQRVGLNADEVPASAYAEEATQHNAAFRFHDDKRIHR